MKNILSLGADFLWKNARLLERRLFAFHFLDGSDVDAKRALLAYQNADGGFGNALEPDIRGPVSQPEHTHLALGILSEIGFDKAVAQRACNFLEAITTGEGGVPFVLPAGQAFPHAPWWDAIENPPASLNPTAGIAGVLLKHQFQHPWVDRASQYCWERIPTSTTTEMHELGVILDFLRYAPDRVRADQEYHRLAKHLVDSHLVADVNSEGYVRKPLDWAPTPDHPLRPFLAQFDFDANLDWLMAQQQPDGGWPVTWPTVSPACEMEWRGWLTLRALLTLKAYGSL